MIIWLASYPRSGNTLLRTLLHQCFDLETYDDETGTRLLGVLGVGATPLDSDWDDFYPRANSSTSLKLVKSHKYPRDDQPAIYIYRDGRLTIQSYLEFHRSFVDSGVSKTLLSLVMGDDYYGSWSRHYQVWTTRAAPTLILNFEELIAAKPELIRKIGDFIGVNPVRLNWTNPMTELQQKKPDFFRSGSTNWQPALEWTNEIDQIFNFYHGGLMVELGYSSQETVDAAIAELSPSACNILEVVAPLSARCASLQFHCDERLRVIKQLSGS
ncbi:MAG TPA: sulfotransferase domain-containing protein [Methylotenera sp.]|nr:sulfotransferase domain-containing protein [Methylotenera sp.]